VSTAIDGLTVRSYYRDPVAVRHYVDAATRLGLWASEETVLTKVFDQKETLLDCGCGAGRIAFGLWELGFRHLLGFDFSREMIVEARRMARLLEYQISFRVADATRLDFVKESFDGAIFGFNGLMQIPMRANRQTALSQISTVLRPGGHLVFTTHDRDLICYQSLWEKEQRIWKVGRQSPSLGEFGDRHFSTPQGRIFMHIPRTIDVCEDLKSSGFVVVETHLRSELANESAEVREFSEECRFWIARRL
jgi:ubiquinone/menaquinone biosynthesis C-methylase UbiE